MEEFKDYYTQLISDIFENEEDVDEVLYNHREVLTDTIASAAFGDIYSRLKLKSKDPLATDMYALLLVDTIAKQDEKRTLAILYYLWNERDTVVAPDAHVYDYYHMQSSLDLRCLLGYVSIPAMQNILYTKLIIELRAKLATGIVPLRDQYANEMTVGYFEMVQELAVRIWKIYMSMVCQRTTADEVDGLVDCITGELSNWKTLFPNADATPVLEEHFNKVIETVRAEYSRIPTRQSANVNPGLVMPKAFPLGNF